MNKNSYTGQNNRGYHGGRGGHGRGQGAPFEYYSYYNYNEMPQQPPQYRPPPSTQQSLRERAAKILEYKPRVKNSNDSTPQKMTQFTPTTHDNQHQNHNPYAW